MLPEGEVIGALADSAGPKPLKRTSTNCGSCLLGELNPDGLLYPS